MNALKAVLVIVGLIVVGMLAWWLLKLVFSLALYLIVGALVVGACWYAYNRYGGPTRTRRR
ncbi:hypothetical protein [Dactylosporangium sp. NPDC051484]|uniref:hypothetical protein n=1 Tax=Dactylosporangium sp. NPDC051484 TaxID=3154942 RepID=UPI00344F3869